MLENNSITIRPFPYPYKAGLAICSDIDTCDRTSFLKIHRYLNLELGLPVSDSFFPLGQDPGQMAYFLKDGKTPSPDAPLICRAIQDGLIDSIHSWGDFNGSPPDPFFLKNLAKNMTNALNAESIKIRIWINHGDPCNYQNFIVRLQPDNYKGDDPDSPYYTADLLDDLGINYYWWSELAGWPLSGKWNRYSPGLWPRLGINALKNMVKSFIIKEKFRNRTSEQLTDLMLPFTLRDGRKLMAFTRFCYPPESKIAATRYTLRHSLGINQLQKLINQQGYMVLYTHLALPELWKPGKSFFPNPDQKALKGLARYYNNGKIWVASTLSLLNYYNTSRNLVWKSRTFGEKHIITIQYINDPCRGQRTPESHELAGICFYCPEPENTHIFLNKKQLNTQINKPDHTGKPSLALALPPAPKTRVLEE
ncbi:Uncharacterized protein dnl_57150 [Desulfonema limicola]|uniref:Uncharacterized protein n=1 Tax=Desulfonema limicola TaxID=45656 RepID=A0A975BDL2_9BACT|nr:hypothetical protein [Desulfonema limicola]QTA83315.1 Uncharacterized protein dnl_57150 [Desulfonema limicola]